MTPIVTGHFPVPLRGEWDLSGDRFTTTDTFVYHDAEKGWHVEVPAGTVTDFSSIPRVLWPWFPPTEAPAAGLVHDWLYRHPEGRSRRLCDEMWRRILDLSGVRKSKRLTAWLGLRTGGWVAWGRYRERETAG